MKAQTEYYYSLSSDTHFPSFPLPQVRQQYMK
jgi:hypothetical protein